MYSTHVKAINPNTNNPIVVPAERDVCVMLQVNNRTRKERKNGERDCNVRSAKFFQDRIFEELPCSFVFGYDFFLHNLK